MKNKEGCHTASVFRAQLSPALSGIIPAVHQQNEISIHSALNTPARTLQTVYRIPVIRSALLKTRMLWAWAAQNMYPSNGKFGVQPGKCNALKHGIMLFYHLHGCYLHKQKIKRWQQSWENKTPFSFCCFPFLFNCISHASSFIIPYI